MEGAVSRPAVVSEQPQLNLPATSNVSSRPELSVVIPAYNEESRLPPTLERVERHLSDLSIRFEIVVADDGSNDGTSAVARALRHARVERLPHHGKGAATRSGVLASQGEFVLVSDADLSTPISDYRLLRESLEQANADVAVGSRRLDRSKLQVPQPFHRQLMGRVFSLVVQALVLPGIKDSQCGFKLFRREAALAVFERCRVDGFAFDVEALALARNLGFSVIEVPVHWRDSPESRVDPVRDPLRMLGEVFQIAWRFRRPARAAGGASLTVRRLTSSSPSNPNGGTTS